MTIVLLGIVGLTAGMLLYQGTVSFQEMDARKELMAQGTLAVERASRELRVMKCTQSGSACAPTATDLPSMTATEVRFLQADYSGTGIRLDGATIKLRRGAGALDAEDILADRVSSFLLEYKKKDGAAAATQSEVWTISMSFTLTKDNESAEFNATVHPRSLR